MSAFVQTAVGAWRYSGPSQNGEGWFIAFLDDAGCLSVQSDFGDYSYRWPMHGMPPGRDGKPCRMREWVAEHLGRDPSYVLGKLSHRDEFDDEGSARAVRQFIWEAFEAGDLDDEEASEEWELVDSDLDGARSGDAWIRQTSLEEPWHHLGNRYPQQAQAFMARVFPRLVAAVKAELELEASLVSAAVKAQPPTEAAP